MSGAPHLTAEQRLKNMTTEIGGGRATSRNLERAVEMGNMPAARPRAENPFSDEAAPPYEGREPVDSEGRREGSVGGMSEGSDAGGSERTRSSVGGRPQVVRSMLDI